MQTDFIALTVPNATEDEDKDSPEVQRMLQFSNQASSESTLGHTRSAGQTTFNVFPIEKTNPAKRLVFAG